MKVLRVWLDGQSESQKVSTFSEGEMTQRLTSGPLTGNEHKPVP